MFIKDADCIHICRYAISTIVHDEFCLAPLCAVAIDGRSQREQDFAGQMAEHHPNAVTSMAYSQTGSHEA